MVQKEAERCRASWGCRSQEGGSGASGGRVGGRLRLEKWAPQRLRRGTLGRGRAGAGTHRDWCLPPSLRPCGGAAQRKRFSLHPSPRRVSQPGVRGPHVPGDAGVHGVWGSGGPDAAAGGGGCDAMGLPLGAVGFLNSDCDVCTTL